MDKRKSILNVTVSVACKIVTLILVILVKRLLIQECGNEVNGLNALYLSVIGFLSVAELGVGSAITFCMYKPIVEGDNHQVSALYQLFRKLYLVVSGVILVGGLLLTPFIHHFAKDYAALDVNLYSTFVLMLLSVVVTYWFSAKTSLINAYKNNYITTAITSGGIILQYILQIIVLLLTGSYVAYLICRIVAALAQWVVTNIITRRKYPGIIADKQRINEETKHTLVRSIRAMFMHRIGILLVNTVDNVVISIFVGVVALGRYSNYTVILDSMAGLLNVAFASLTSVVGHLCVQRSKETAQRYHEGFHLVNFMIGCVFYLGYYAIIDELIALLFDANLVEARSVTFVIALNGFVQFMRRSTLTFREATGTFYNDRWKPLLEGVVNIIFSIILVKKFGVVGVLVATIVTNLLICHVVEPYVLFKHGFSATPAGYYVRNYLYIIAFGIGMVLFQHFAIQDASMIGRLLANGCISVAISAGICGVTLLLLRDQRRKIKEIFWGRSAGNE